MSYWANISCNGPVGVGYCHHSPSISFFGCYNIITRIIQIKFCQYKSTSGSSELAIYRLSLKRLLVRNREGQDASSKPYLFTLDSSLFYPSLISSTIRTSPPILPHCPSVEVGLVPVPVWLPWVTSIGRLGFRISTAGSSGLTCAARRSPLVAVPDHSKGVVPLGQLF